MNDLRAGKVMALLTQITENPRGGSPLSSAFKPITPADKQNEEVRKKHDDELLNALVLHLTKDGRLPSCVKLQKTAKSIRF